MKKLMLTIAMLFTLTFATSISAQDIQQDLLTKEQLKAHKAAEKAIKKIEKTKADAIKKAKAAEKAAAKAKSLEKKYKDRVSFFYKENGGAATARNFGISKETEIRDVKIKSGTGWR